VNDIQIFVTALTTLLAVLLGSWLTTRWQERLWERDQDRQWRDIRLRGFTEFLTAFREYVAYASIPTVHIEVVTRPGPPHDSMPFFDETGTAYKERLEATKTSLRMITSRSGTVTASTAMVQNARSLAAARATHGVDTIPTEHFERLWRSEHEFVSEARRELGLSPMPSSAPRAGPDKREPN
jgi:hypothetical protein